MDSSPGVGEIEELLGGPAAPKQERHAREQLVVVEAHEVLIAIDGLAGFDTIEELAVEQEDLDEHRGSDREVVLGLGFADERRVGIDFVVGDWATEKESAEALGGLA